MKTPTQFNQNNTFLAAFDKYPGEISAAFDYKFHSHKVAIHQLIF